jgi:peptidoglycan/LPS O-acetylase OafA/YrhL
VGTTAPELDSGGDGSSEFKRDYIDAFASYGWIAVIVWAALATIFTALFVPAGYGGRIATGFLVLGVLGALINLADRRGSVGPRLTGAIATLAGAAAFGVGVSILFDGDFAPSIGYGVWVGAAGLGLVLLACLIGTRRTPAAA